MPSAFVANPHHDDAFRPQAPPTAPRRLVHERLPAYAATPCPSVPALADAWRVGHVFVKDESRRCGLDAFKVLGASWAAYRLLVRALGVTEGAPLTALDTSPLGGRRLVTATDGNHGRAVAWTARTVGLDAEVFVPADTVPARIGAIQGEGTTVRVVDGDYDAACAAAAASLDDNAWLVSDTYWPGHEDVPGWVIDGYSTMFHEIDDVIAPRDVDVVVVPIGVGALAAACIRHYRSSGNARPVVVGVEPDDANCLQQSLLAGAIVTAPGPHRTPMVGLNCGTPSLVAWPTLHAGLDSIGTVSTDEAEAAMRLLYAAGVRAGGTGAASAAGAQKLLQDNDFRAAHDIGPNATVLVLNTEGPTDPAHFQAVVGG